MEGELAKLKLEPDKIQKMINGLAKERDDVVKDYDGLKAAVKHSASGQVTSLVLTISTCEVLLVSISCSSPSICRLSHSLS